MTDIYNTKVGSTKVDAPLTITLPLEVVIVGSRWQ